MRSTIWLSFLLALVSRSNAAMGPAFSTGPVGSNSWIQESISTLIVPNAPAPTSGDVSLWTGMGTDKGDLIQGIVDNAPGSGTPCRNLGTNWCIYAYTLVQTGPHSQQPKVGKPIIAGPGSRITMHYKYDNATQLYDQDLYINGTLASNITSSQGHKAMGFGTAIECANTACGSVPEHYWVNTTITMFTPDPTYSRTMAKGRGVTGAITTTDGGKTWKADSIYIPQYKFSG